MSSSEFKSVSSPLNPLDKVTRRVWGGLAWPGTPDWTPKSCRSECTVPKKTVWTKNGPNVRMTALQHLGNSGLNTFQHSGDDTSTSWDISIWKWGAISETLHGGPAYGIWNIYRFPSVLRLLTATYRGPGWGLQGGHLREIPFVFRFPHDFPKFHWSIPWIISASKIDLFHFFSKNINHSAFHQPGPPGWLEG